MTTLKDVARLASVDVSTVSRALNNSAQVHPETKAKILMAAKRLGYKPELVSKSMLPDRRNLIAVILPSATLNIFSDLLSEFQIKARNRGYGVLVAYSKAEQQDEAKALNDLHAFVDGILIVPTCLNAELLRDIHSRGTSIVQLIRKHDEDISSVTSNYYDICRKSVRLLYEKGCRHIGLLHGHKAINTFSERLSGYLKEIGELSLPELTAGTDKIAIPDYEDGIQGTLSLLEQDPELDGILVESDLEGMGALRILKEKGLPCPEKVRILSLTGSFLGQISETKISSAEFPISEMAEKALDLLLSSIEMPKDKKPSTIHIVFNGLLKERETT
ncbi:MAG: LacI family transcriptional regulator [Lachnospiraceae bacterium]|nr:LacI family transcriptional regulator [Lachnospiraceae bacterium]